MAEQREVWTIRKVLEWTRSYLSEKGIENARLESEWLLAHSLETDRVGLYTSFDKPLTASELAQFRGLVIRRARREPLQYILGTQEFFGLDFDVTPDVLIPRHDTEVLAEEAIRRADGACAILDIGAGSGCLAIALAKKLSAAVVTAVDISPAALSVARRNAERHSVGIEFLEGSLFTAVAGRKFDIIVSNPPYIATAEIAGLQPEVRDFEPVGALDGGEDGLSFYREIVSSAPLFLNEGGWLLLEVGAGQAAPVMEMLQDRGLAEIASARDTGGIERVVGGRNY